jgi:ribA/ribD-fused uncharacterized protein
MKRDTTWTAVANWLACLLGLALGAAFLYSGVMKRLDPYKFAQAVLAYDLLPQRLVGLVAAILPWVEITGGFFLVLGCLVEIPGRVLRGLGFSWGDRLLGGIKRRSCLLLIALILAVFLVVLVITLARGLEIDCGCGLVADRLVGWGAILEDALMLAVALFLYWWALRGAEEPRVEVGRRISKFEGKNYFLSNYAPARVKLNGLEFPTVEHAYQAAKTLEAGVREKIRGASTPGLAKKMGRKLDKRPDWPEVKVEVMRDLILQKFAQHPDLQKRLLATGDAELVEGNTWHDNFWGDCHCPRCAASPGQNRLGVLLMEVRRHLGEAG